MKADDTESLWIQTRAFHLLQELESEDNYYSGIDLREGKRVRKLLMAANAHHAIIIQSIQTGNLKRAMIFLLGLKKVSEEIKAFRCQADEAIRQRFIAAHER